MFTKKTLNIDIGTNTIKIITGTLTKDLIKVTEAFILQTPEGTVSDGNILDIPLLKETIQTDLVKRNIKLNEVNFTIASTETITREIVLPKVRRKKLEKMIPFEVERQLPILLEDYVLDYIEIEELNENNFKKVRLQIGALPKVIVEDYLQLAAALSLKPKSLVIHSQSIAQLSKLLTEINNKPFESNLTIAFLEISQHYINCNIVANGVALLNRFIPIAQLEIEEWLQDVERVFRFFLNIKKDNIIDKIYLYGGRVRAQDVGTVENGLNISTELIEKLGNVQWPEYVKSEDIGLYLNALGALI